MGSAWVRLEKSRLGLSFFLRLEIRADPRKTVVNMVFSQTAGLGLPARNCRAQSG
jgi:hypothetical protein